MHVDDFIKFFIAFQDHAAPKLDVYEQAIYLYIARHTQVIGASEAVIGFKSARKKMAFGTGKAGTPPSEGVVYEKLKSLERKGFVKVLASERTGTKIRLISPFDIAGLIAVAPEALPLSLEDADFFEHSHNRKLILEREGFACFYCLRSLDENNYVIEHVVSRPAGNNSYKNLVASCRQCNNRKDAGSADSHLKIIYREGLLNQTEHANRHEQLGRLVRGELRPAWPV